MKEWAEKDQEEEEFDEEKEDPRLTPRPIGLDEHSSKNGPDIC